MKLRSRHAGALVAAALLSATLVAVSASPAPAAFTGWERLGGTLTGEPAVASWGPGRIDVFARGTDAQLWHRWFGGTWSRWEPLGGTLTSAPTVASWGPGRLDVFARGSANQLIHRYYENRWSAWETLGGTLDSAPSASSWGAGRLDVFARASSGALAHIPFALPWGAWGRWETLGGVLNGAPGAVSWYANRIDVFVRGTNDHLYQRTFAGAWAYWADLGGTITAPPAAAGVFGGRLEVFVRGADLALYRNSLYTGWSGFARMDGVLTSGPAVAAWAPGRTDVFARGTDDALYHRWEEATGNWPPPPLGSGAGRRIVYCNSCQRAWHVNDDGSWYTFLVSGRRGVPNPAVYQVFRRVNPGGSGSLRLPFFVGFAHGSTTDIGFHGIPLRSDGSPIQSDAELGQYRSHGCVRQSQADAVRTWDFAPIGTTVVVIP